MNGRQRFIETMHYRQPDRTPFLEEGIREPVIDFWKGEGHDWGGDILDYFHFDRREEFEPDLETRHNLARVTGSRQDLARLRKSYKKSIDRRLPRDWDERVEKWKKREDILFLIVHEGFFLSMGVDDWIGFSNLMYLVKDKPDFVREVLRLQGELAAQAAERVLQSVKVDAAIFSEPIGGNTGPLISPVMYADFLLPTLMPTISILKKFEVDILIYRTYANTRILLPLVLDAGINCLWAVERNCAEMDYLKLRAEFGNQLRLIGGLDRDQLRDGQQAIEEELQRVVPSLMANGGYIPLIDGRIREDIPFENYRYYRRRLEKLVQT